MTNSFLVTSSQYKMNNFSEDKNIFVFDIETNGLYNDVSEIFCLVIFDVNRQQTFTYGPDCIADALEHLAKAHVLIGHNIIFYDLPVIRKLYPFYTFKAPHIIDTLICARVIWPKELLTELDNTYYFDIEPRLKGSASLKAWGHRLKENKLSFKDFSGYSEEMATYCRQDVTVTYKLFQYIQLKEYAESALKLEHEFAIQINNQIVSGFPFDVDRCLDLVDMLRTKQIKLEEELQLLFPPIIEDYIFTPKVNNQSRGYVKDVPHKRQVKTIFNPGSRKQIINHLAIKYNWVPDKITEKGNPILNDIVLESLPFPETKALAEYQLLKKRLGQIVDGDKAWLKLVNKEDNKMHGDLITNGCITGRCSHRNPNMAQVPGAYSPYGKECRELFHAPKGYVLIGVDAKALELRCLAGYLAYWDKGEYSKLVIDPDIDIHTYNQKQFGVDSRDVAKRLLYGLLYGCGAIKAGTIIDPNEKSESVLRTLGSTAINSFMDKVDALKTLKEYIKKYIIKRKYLVGLDGRQLFCRSEFKGLNVLLQSAGALLMKQVVINIAKNLEEQNLIYGTDWMQVAMVHDEVQLACLPQHKELVKEQALLAFPQAQKYFNFLCKIEGDAKIGYTWLDCH